MSYFQKNIYQSRRLDLIRQKAADCGYKFRRWPWLLRWYSNWRSRSVTWPWGSVWLCDKVLEYLPVLAHELRHAQQQKADGAWTFVWRYFTSFKWRYRYEVEAEAHEALMRARLLQRNFEDDPFGMRGMVHADALAHGKMPYCIPDKNPGKVLTDIAEMASELGKLRY